jgi:hypothetical protein
MCCSYVLGKVYGDNAPNFDDDQRQKQIGQLQPSHQRMRSTQALLREMRVRLRQNNRYKGSKLEIMDHFHVKLSELSEWPLYLGTFDRKPVAEGFYDKKSVLLVRRKRKDRPPKVPKTVKSGIFVQQRSPRPKRKSVKHDDSEYEYGDD